MRIINLLFVDERLFHILIRLVLSPCVTFKGHTMQHPWTLVCGQSGPSVNPTSYSPVVPTNAQMPRHENAFQCHTDCSATSPVRLSALHIYINIFMEFSPASSWTYHFDLLNNAIGITNIYNLISYIQNGKKIPCMDKIRIWESLIIHIP